jgi:hypothetical protein
MPEPRYAKGDRVWIRRGSGISAPGVVIGYYVDWDLYRVVYTVTVDGRKRTVMEEWRLSHRGGGAKR